LKIVGARLRLLVPSAALAVFVPNAVEQPLPQGIIAADFAADSVPRAVSDPGVVTTRQTITPAGTQAVFDGRVLAVAFRAGDEIWTTIDSRPAKLVRLAYQSNELRASVGAGGNLNPHGLAFDPNGRPYMAVGAALPIPGSAANVETASGGSGRPAARQGLRLATLDGDSVRFVGQLGWVGAQAGMIAVSLEDDGERGRVAVLAITDVDSIAVADVTSGSALRTIWTNGIAPWGVALDRKGRVAYVSNLGGPIPRKGQASMRAGPRASDSARIDKFGRAMDGSVVRIDLTSGNVTHTMEVGRHPTVVLWNEQREELYVANSNDDVLSVIDTRNNSVARTIKVNPFVGAPIGIAPTALVMHPDGSTLFVTLAGINAVGVIDVESGNLRGMIPTSWYPSSIAVNKEGTAIVVGATLGVGSGEAQDRMRGGDWDSLRVGPTPRYVHRYRGTVAVIPIPNATELAAYTATVAQNTRLPLNDATSEQVVSDLVPRKDVAARAVPERLGEPSPIQHVVYIVKENRTYDQIFGDIGKGNSDSTLVMYGKDITPNHHRLANEYVLLDNFYAVGGNSANGHQWVTQANETEYTLYPLYGGRSYPFEGSDPLALSKGGAIWDAVLGKGMSVMVFGEYVGTVQWKDSAMAARAADRTAMNNNRTLLLETYRKGEQPGDLFNTIPPNPAMTPFTARDFPGYGGQVPDVVRAQIFKTHLAGWMKEGKMPNLVMIQLPSDHTGGTSPGYSTPAATLADNDLAMGQIVDALSHTQFWKSMAIFVVEDDAQGGVDHVDGHRTVALAISPYIKKGTIDNTFYSHPSMLRTMELMLGLAPLSIFDRIANDMRASFIDAEAAPDFTPYTAVEPTYSIYELNPASTGLRGAERAGALASMKMRFDVPDAVPSDKLNRILWHTARGWSTPYPKKRVAVMSPFDTGDPDDDDEVEVVRPPKKQPRTGRK
jgi:YVTN family beta-propeller protein